MWTLVPLGNPGTEYQDTRHNLGRLMLQRWMAERGLAPAPRRRFPSGTLYPLTDRLQALVPATYMNLSGEACAQASAAGLYPRRMVILFDYKDLPLGTGRFRLNGSDGGHNGLRSVFECLGTQEVARLRLGIGPLTPPSPGSSRFWPAPRTWMGCPTRSIPRGSGGTRARLCLDFRGFPGETSHSRPPLEGSSLLPGIQRGLHIHKEDRCVATRPSSSPPPR